MEMYFDLRTDVFPPKIITKCFLESRPLQENHVIKLHQNSMVSSSPSVYFLVHPFLSTSQQKRGTYF